MFFERTMNTKFALSTIGTQKATIETMNAS